MEQLKQIYTQIVEGDMNNIEASVQAALDAGISAEVILHQALIAAMGEVGKLFEEGEYFVPDMLISARSMQMGLAVLKPQLINSEVKSAGKIAIGTVKGDMHDIGKNLVALMLEGGGFEVIDLGVDVPPEKFVEAAASGDVQIIALSALLTTTMPNMQVTLEAIQQAGLRDKVKVIIGGAPVTQEYATLIGADGYSQDASRAVTLARALLA